MKPLRKRLSNRALSLTVITTLIAAGCSQSAIDSASSQTTDSASESAALRASPFETSSDSAQLSDTSIVLLPGIQSRSLKDRRPSGEPQTRGSQLTLRPGTSADAETAKKGEKPVATKPTLVPFEPVVIGSGDVQRKPGSTALFRCGTDDENTDVEITGPDENSILGVGTTLNWERAYHDPCGAEGIRRRYTIAVCLESTAGNCNPANGFFNANVLPEDLLWSDTTPGHYTLNQDHIDILKDKAGVQNGQTVYFQIRYKYTLRNTLWGEWDTRAFTFDDNPVDAIPDTLITQRPIITTPGEAETYSDTPPYDVVWDLVTGADYYRVKLTYRRSGSPSGTDFGIYIGESEVRETVSPYFSSTERAPAHTSLIVWSIEACNTAGCGPRRVQGFFVSPVVPADPTRSFAAILPAFKAASCINCHAVAANAAGFEIKADEPYETGDNFGLPPGHSNSSNCTSCHSANLTPGGSHPVPWQAAPASMDLRGRSNEELCLMAKNPGSLAENIQDHLLGDPLILWAVVGGELPLNAGNTDSAFGSSPETALDEWETAVNRWIETGASCL